MFRDTPNLCFILPPSLPGDSTWKGVHSGPDQKKEPLGFSTSVWCTFHLCLWPHTGVNFVSAISMVRIICWQFNSILLNHRRKYGYYSDRTCVRNTCYWLGTCLKVVRSRAIKVWMRMRGTRLCLFCYSWLNVFLTIGGILLMELRDHLDTTTVTKAGFLCVLTSQI